MADIFDLHKLIAYVKYKHISIESNLKNIQEITVENQIAINL